MRSHRSKSMVCWVVCIFACLAVMGVSPAAFAKQSEVNVGVVAAVKFVQGEHTWYGAELAAEEINAAGGVKLGGNSYKINLIKADSNEWGSIADAVAAMERVITVDKVKMVLGGYRSEAVLAMQEVAAEYQCIYFSVGAGHSQIPGRLIKDYDKYKYWFREGKPWSLYGVMPLLGMIGNVTQKYKEQLGIAKPKVAILAEKVLWADEVTKYLQKVLPGKLGLPLVGVWRCSPGANDVRVELNAIKAAGAQIIIHLVSGAVGIATGRQWGGLKIPTALIGYNGEAQKMEYWKTTGGNCNYEALVEYVVSIPINERTANFWKKFKAKYKTTPMECALSYNALWIWKEAVERAGSFDSEKVVPEIEKTNFKGVGGNWRYHPKGSKLPHDIVWGPGAFTVFGTQWRDGERKVVWPDGKPLLGDPRWENVRFKGTVEYELPPWAIAYWKKHKK